MEEKLQEAIIAVIDDAFLKNISDANKLELAPNIAEYGPKEYIVSMRKVIRLTSISI
jgi:hypothetical protein